MEPKKNIERCHIQALFKRLQKLRHPIPDSIEEAESPDFILRVGQERVGLEVTRSVYQEYVRGTKLHDRRYPAEWIIRTNLMDGSRRRSNDEIVAEMLNLGEDTPWKSCEQDMRDWRDKIARSLSTKRERLNQPNFQHCNRNWLLIYDQPGLANDTFTFDRAYRHLAELFSTPTKRSLDYDAVFVLSSRYLFRWQNNELSLHYDKGGS